MNPNISLIVINISLVIVGIFLFKENRNTKMNRHYLMQLIIFGCLFLITSLLNMAEVRIDSLISSKIGRDFSILIYNIEKDAVAFFQKITNPILDYYFTFIYMIGFPFIIYFTPLLYILSKDIKTLKIAVFSYAMGLIISLPFMLFFPVYDAWWCSINTSWYDGKMIYFRLEEIWPSVITVFFKYTTIDNCFPSLHAALSAIMAYTAWIGNYRRYKYVATLIAVSIPIASWYLGIHWILDAVAGEIVALISIFIALNVFKKEIKWRQ